MLSETGLFVPGTEQLSPGVREYMPAFELWSDGATKRRWFWLPPNTTIDVSDQDDWRFPVGTRFWKEFTRDGVRVETRLLLKTGEADDSWEGAAYLWGEGDAVLTPEGAASARGTEHDVPAADRCFGCHGGRASRVLGFSAIQLANTEGPLALREVETAGLLSAPAPAALVPGTPDDRAVLGLLHANCGHCHNARRPTATGPRCYDPRNTMNLSLEIEALDAVSSTGVMKTVVGKEIDPGNPSHSKAFELYSHRGPAGAFGPSQMPPLATKRVDETGVARLRAWIEGLR